MTLTACFSAFPVAADTMICGSKLLIGREYDAVICHNCHDCEWGRKWVRNGGKAFGIRALGERNVHADGRKRGADEGKRAMD